MDYNRRLATLVCSRSRNTPAELVRLEAEDWGGMESDMGSGGDASEQLFAMLTQRHLELEGML